MALGGKAKVTNPWNKLFRRQQGVNITGAIKKDVLKLDIQMCYTPGVQVCESRCNSPCPVRGVRLRQQLARLHSAHDDAVQVFVREELLQQQT